VAAATMPPFRARTHWVASVFGPAVIASLLNKSSLVSKPRRLLCRLPDVRRRRRPNDPLPIWGNQQWWCCETARYRSTVCRPATWRPMTGQVNYCLLHPVCEMVRCSRMVISLRVNAGRTSPSLRGRATPVSSKSSLAFNRFIPIPIARRESYASLLDHVKEKFSATRFVVADSQHSRRCAGRCDSTRGRHADLRRLSAKRRARRS
jgi:hypothetical protein